MNQKHQIYNQFNTEERFCLPVILSTSQVIFAICFKLR